MLIGSASSGGSAPSAPTIGAATDGGTGTTASVAFTPSTYIGKGTITYTATSSPGGLTASSSGSPITVSGLTTGTPYTFTVVGTTNYGVSSNASAASNSITPALPAVFNSIASSTTNASSWTFSSIPNTYRHLQLRAFIPVNLSLVHLRFNGVTSATYAFIGDSTNGTTGNRAGGVAENYITVGSPGYNTGSLSGSGFVINIYNYANTNTNTYVTSEAGYYEDASNKSYSHNFGLWGNTSVVNSLTLTVSSTSGTGTNVALYGIS